MNWTKAGYGAIGFVIPFVATVIAAFVARRKATSDPEDDLAGRELGPWAIGLSAATTGSSGFIVTGAIGLGYLGGLQALLMPLAWLIGDLIFWAYFPGMLNALARSSNAVTIPELIAAPFTGVWRKMLTTAAALVTVGLLAPYAAGQWMAGQKIIGGIVNMPVWFGVTAVAALVVSYSTIGGFRGSVYTDIVQAVIRIGGTLLALSALVVFALNSPGFAANIRAAGADYLSLVPSGGFLALAGAFSYMGTAVGFGLGQPQVTSRYLAGESPEAAQAARWIYIFFMQGTWVAMTVFGILLRGVMPNLADPETGLSAFFTLNMGPFLTGLIFADIFATVAATANGILVAISQIFRRHLMASFLTGKLQQNGFIVVAMGIFTILLSLLLPRSVAQTTIVAGSLMGAGLGGAVLIRATGWRTTGPALFAALAVGILTGLAWRFLGYPNYLNETTLGLGAAVLANAIVVRSSRKEIVASPAFEQAGN